MTNKDKYKQAFSGVHVSEDFILEAKIMKKSTKHGSFRPVAAVLMVCILLVGSASVAYAADVGGIQRMVQIWMHGDLTAATITFDGDGGYAMEYIGTDGSVHQKSGRGVSTDADGIERPLTEEEILDYLAMPEVAHLEDGSVWVYWFDQAQEITDCFENGVCYVKLVSGGNTLYMTVKYPTDYAISQSAYVMPEAFNG